MASQLNEVDDKGDSRFLPPDGRIELDISQLDISQDDIDIARLQRNEVKEDGSRSIHDLEISGVAENGQAEAGVEKTGRSKSGVEKPSEVQEPESNLHDFINAGQEVKSDLQLQVDAINSLYDGFPSPQEIQGILQNFFRSPNIGYASGYGIYPGENQGAYKAGEKSDASTQASEKPASTESPRAESEKPEPEKPEAKEDSQARPAASGVLPEPVGTIEPQPSDCQLDYLKKRFKSFDKDNNDHVTVGEVDSYIKENKDGLSEAELKALSVLKENMSRLEELHNDEWLDENDGLTRADLNLAEKRMKAFEFADGSFNQIDSDKDGFLSGQELNDYGLSKADSLSAAQKASLDYLKDKRSYIEEESNDEWGDENDGITRNDLKAARKGDGTSQFASSKPGDADSLPGVEIYKAPTMKREGRVSKEDFSKEAIELFERLDKNKNGFLSETELADAVESDQFNGKDAQVLAALYRAQDGLEELSNDEFLDENSGVTRNDLTEFDRLQKEDSKNREEPSKVRNWLKSNDRFNNLDTDKDEYLSYREINKALEADNLSQTDKDNLEFLKKNYCLLENSHDDEFGFENDGITLDDLDYYGDRTVSKVGSSLQRTHDGQQNGNRQLFADSANPLASIKPESIKQGMIGNCYLEAAVASIAATQPELIRDMISENGDGTYTVTFPGAPDEPITVDAPTEAELGLFNKGSKDGVWASVLEKAYGKYSQGGFWRRTPNNLGGGDTACEGADGGEFFQGRAMSLLTGKGRDTDWLSLTSESALRRKLSEAFSAEPKRPVMAGINDSIFDDETSDGFPRAHAYSVLGFDPDGEDGGTITIRNPWGGDNSSPRGMTKISLREFRKNFSDIAFSK